MVKKVIIFSAPSGAGKSTIVGHCLKKFPQLAFSTSAASRAPRGHEVNGKDYYFISVDEFRSKIAADEFVEWQEVYPGSFYGTLKQEVERLWKEGKIIVFDVDVKGGYNLKRFFGDKALSVFIQVPSIDVLRDRLLKRNTDSPEAIEKRLAKAGEEMDFAKGKFDYTLVNSDLSTALSDITAIITDFLSR